MSVVRTNGLDIAYECAGEGPVLVFAHGAVEDGRVWQSQLAALSDEFTVVVLGRARSGTLFGPAHAVHPERPEPVSAAIRDFCRAHPAR